MLPTGFHRNPFAPKNPFNSISQNKINLMHSNILCAEKFEAMIELNVCLYHGLKIRNIYIYIKLYCNGLMVIYLVTSNNVYSHWCYIVVTNKIY